MSNLNLNKVVLAGRLTADPELKLTQIGVSVVSFNLAINRSAKVVNNQKVTETDFITCVAWRQRAEFISKYFKKGSALCITGSIQTRTWNDNEGNKRYATEVLVDEAMFVDSLSNNKQGENTYVPEAYIEPANLEKIESEEELPF